MRIQLPDDLASSIRAEVLSGHFASEDDLVAAAVRDYLHRKQVQAAPNQSTARQEEPGPTAKPIGEEIEEITAGIPHEEFLKLPVDGAEQHDHYL